MDHLPAAVLFSLREQRDGHRLAGERLEKRVRRSQSRALPADDGGHPQVYGRAAFSQGDRHRGPQFEPLVGRGDTAMRVVQVLMRLEGKLVHAFSRYVRRKAVVIDHLSAAHVDREGHGEKIVAPLIVFKNGRKIHAANVAPQHDALAEHAERSQARDHFQLLIQRAAPAPHIGPAFGGKQFLSRGIEFVLGFHAVGNFAQGGDAIGGAVFAAINPFPA